MGPNVATPLRELPKQQTRPDTSAPIIPFDVIDAPSQRLFVFSFYAVLFAYRLYDFYTLTVDDVESTWLFMKWFAIDGVFLFGLPVMRIPWLEWGPYTVVAIFLVHAVFDGMLMFRIGIPFGALFLAILKIFSDSELAIAERKVSTGKILNSASLILGKQIINILPEGSALLNPKREPFCLNAAIHQIDIPIQINQTKPILIELLRIDLDTMQNETITISASTSRKLMKAARKSQKTVDPASPLILRYPVKKTGVYVLQKVVDETKLEVQPRTSSVVVVTCPLALVKPTGNNRCRGELSNVALEVQGTPPLRIKYRTTVNGVPREASEFQSLQPEDFVSPLTKQTSNALIRNGNDDVSWAQSHRITVPLNETLGSSGKWTYSIEEVQDAVGNIVSYINPDDEEKPKARLAELQQSFDVHERPTIALRGCDSEHPLQAAKGQMTLLPVQYGSTGKTSITNSPHTIEYLFTPEDALHPNGGHSATAELKTDVMNGIHQQPKIMEPGLYTLHSVSTKFCKGEVLEPASCVLENPPEPDLTLVSVDIVDKCAGNPIGLRVRLDLVGSPPFVVHYSQHKKGQGQPRTHYERVATFSGQLELTPPEAGHYTYTFYEISDSVYTDGKSLKSKNLVLEQDVKPSASAHFIDSKPRKEACIDEPISFSVRLQGEGPWTLDYELVHAGKRTKHTVKDIEDDEYTIRTEKLKNGGEYTLSLVSVIDRLGCKEFLKEDAKVIVRHERPKAYFGQIEGKRDVRTLEGKPVQLPLRLTGTGPWILDYNNIDLPNGLEQKRIYKANSWLETKSEGTYELLSVRDSICPGSIDDKSNQFVVSWISRPEIKIPETSTIVFEKGRYIKDAVCEGDEDSFDVTLTGTAPYEITYEQHHKAKQGGKTISLRQKDLKAAVGVASIRTETFKAGFYEYIFSQLADYNYDHDPKKHKPITVQQIVNPRPDAHFASPGKTYSYCSREADGEEVIPVIFEGVAPFYLEIEIKHHGTSKPETVPFPNIHSKHYDLRIPHRLLHLGHSNIAIRKVRDARGCQRKPPPTAQRVQISVHDAPTVTPLEDRSNFCVGERLSFALSGSMPFTVFYTFNDRKQKANSPGTTFRRLAELPGDFTITGLRDSASDCLASISLTKTIHPIPTVRLSRGLESRVDIHEGGEAELLFEFSGTPPFEFTYTRSTNAKKGKRSQVLETRTEVSYEETMRIRASEEGTYEVISIKDRWCSFAKPDAGTGKGQKLLTY